MKGPTHIPKLFALLVFALCAMPGRSQCNASFTMSYGANGQVNFYSTSSATGTITSYYWDFGNTYNSLNTSTTTSTYNANGIYTVTLYMTASAPNCTSQVSHTISVTTVTAPVCNLTPSFSLSIGANGTATLNNTSTGTSPYTTYTVSFGDGSPSFTTTSMVVPHSYTASGTYTIFLAASNNYTTSNCTVGYSATVTFTSVCNNPSPGIAMTPGPNGTYTFTSISSGTTASSTYSWSFGNTNTAGGVGLTSASTTYTANNFYLITLTILNPPTCTAQTTQTINVSNVPPTCNLAASAVITQTSSGTVLLTSLSTGTNVNTTYTINFGDSPSSITTTAATTLHTYSVNGTYTVMLQVSNNFTTNPPCTDTYTTVIVVNSICTLNAGFNLLPGSNGNVTFVNTTTGTTSATTYSIFWGDGTTNGPNPHTYTSNGVYQVAFLAVDNSTAAACTSTAAQNVTVTSVCTLSPSFSLATVGNGSVSLTNLSTGTNSNTSFSIKWGDGSFNGPNPHGYNSNGTYTVWLLANSTSPSYCIDSTSQVVTITNYCSPMSPDFIIIPGNYGHMTFISTSTGTTALTTYSWTSDTYPVPGTPQSFSSGLPMGQQTFTANGTYAVTLVIHNLSTPSCTFSVTHTLTISNAIPPCNASFTYTMSANTVSFTSTSTGTTGSTIYTWDYGDSTATATGSDAAHTYTASGTYIVSLTISDIATGYSCITSQSISISLPVNCNLAAGLSHTVGNAGSVNFESASTGTTAAAVYHWSFGDGYLGAGNPVNHTYSAGGGYTVMLIVTDGACADSIEVAINVTSAPCTANANFTLTPSGIPQVWNAFPVYPWNVASATWDWGDGSSSDTLYTSHTYSAAGNYSICLTVALICGDTSTYCAPYYVYRSDSANSSTQVILVNVLPPSAVLAGILTVDADDLKYSIYPNPNTGEFTLKLNSAASGRIKLTVTNLVGATVYEEEAGALTEKSMHLNQLSNGIYFITATTGSKTYTRKFIISK